MKNVKINNKWDILIPEHRAARPDWYTKDGWERKRLNLMSKKIGKKDVVFYVGAEEGEMPALCQMWGAKVLMFEPNPKVWPNIKAIWKANKLKDPYTFVGFAGNKSTDSRILQGFDKCADGAVISNHGFMELRNHNAPEIKIDDIKKLTPTVISLDVEGSEWEVLRGAEETLKKHHPKIFLSLHPEFLYEHYKEYAFDLRGWIKNIGYKEKFVDYKHEVHLYYE